MLTHSNKKNTLFREFLKYLIPSVSAMWFFSIYTMIDGMFVGQGVGPTALAAVNLAMPYINTIFSIALLIAVGSSTLIAFYLGENKLQLSRQIFSLNVFLLTAIGVTLSIFSLIFLDELVVFLGATPETFDYVKDYLRIIIISSTFFMVAYSLEVLVKADGFPIYSIIFVTVAAVTNIVLDYVFVIRFQWGVEGAALATGASQLFSCLGFLWHFIFGRSQLKFVKFKLDLAKIKKIVTIGFPEALTELSLGFTTFIFNFFILKYIGAYGVAAFSVIMYLNNLIMMTMIAVNQAMQPLVSYYNGKKETLKIKKLFKLSVVTALSFGVLFFLAAQIFTEQLVSLFITPTHVDAFETAVYGLGYFSFYFLIVGFNVVFSGYFTALKHTKKATLIAFTRGYFIITLSLMFLASSMGTLGIWLAPLVNELLTLILISIVLSSISKHTTHQHPLT